MQTGPQIIDVNKLGDIRWRGGLIMAEELCEYVAKLKIIPARTSIQLNAHSAASYRRVQQVIDALRGLPQLDGIKSIFVRSM